MDKIDIIDEIRNKMVAYEKSLWRKPKKIYLGSNTIWELHKTLAKKHNVEATDKFLCEFFKLLKFSL